MSFYSVSIEQYIQSISEGSVSEVALSHRGLTDEQCTLLAGALANTDKVRVIDCQSNNITSAGVAILCEALKSNNSVSELGLENNKIDATGAHTLLDLLRCNTTLTSISLGFNDVPAELVEAVQFAATMNTQPAPLKEFIAKVQAGEPTGGVLDVSNNAGRFSMQLLKSIMQKTDDITHLCLASDALGDAGADIVGELIKEKPSLQHLDLSGNGIGLHGLRNLIEGGLRSHKSITSLSLANNKIGDDSARIIVDMLRENDSLVELNLDDNAVSQNALTAVDHSLQLNKQPLELKRTLHAVQANDPKLQNIEFMWTPHMELATSFLAPHLKANTEVKVLNLSNARIGDAGATDLAAVLKVNKSLQSVALANNNISCQGAAIIADSLLGNTSLTELNLANNDIALEGGRAFLNLLATNNTLTILNLEINNIGDELMTEVEGLVTINQQPLGLKAILPSIQENAQELVAIDFSTYDESRYHTDASVHVLCQGLKVNSVVTHVNMSNNHIGDQGATSFAEVLFTNATIVNLTIQNCFIGDKGATALSNVLVENSTLQELLLDGNCIGETGGDALLQMLQSNHYINNLSVESNRISPLTVNDIKIACAINLQPISLKQALPQLRAKDPALTELSFSEFDGNRAYNDEATEILCYELRENEHVKVLDLCDNHIGPAGCRAIGAFISEPTTKLEVLKLMGNSIGDEGAAALAEAFTKTTTLTAVDLRSTGITAAGVEVVAESLTKNDTITSILVSKAELPAAVTAHLSRELAVNMQTLNLKRILPAIYANTIEDINFHKASADRTFDDVACRLLSMALAKNTSVTSVDLSGNDITSAGVEFLADMLEDNTNITALNLAENKISDEGAELLIKVLQANDYITALNLDGNAITNPILAEVNYMLRINSGPLPLKKSMIQVAANDPNVNVLEFGSEDTTQRYFDDEAIHILCSLLVDNVNVRVLNLKRNYVTDIGASLLADLLRVNSTLESIDLSFNPIGNEGAMALFKALKGNHTLQHLSLEGCSVHEDVEENLRSVLSVNATRLRQPNRIKGAKPIEEVDNDTQFRDPDYMADCEDKIYDDSLALDCPADKLPKTIPGRITA